METPVAIATIWSRLRRKADVASGVAQAPDSVALAGGGEGQMTVSGRRSVFMNSRRFTSTASNIVLWARSVSALPRNRKPLWHSAKWNRARIRPCASVLKYMR